MENQPNPLLCDIETGMCEVPEITTETSAPIKKSKPNSIKIIYFTDPICSSCWGIEPQLRKLKLEYGHTFEMEYRMGGLLPNWSYNSGGISQPSDVASHWDEASLHYDMPIDGDVWLEDPLDSSYPPSIAFKAAQMQDEKKAIKFMREMRELVFLKKKNIAKWEHIATAALSAELDIAQLQSDYKNNASTLFESDLMLGKSLGVRGFPTLFFIGENGEKETVYGSKSYAFYEMAVLQLNPSATKREYRKDWQTLFSYYNTLTAKEFSELSGMPRGESESHLNDLAAEGHLEKFSTKNGAIWRLIQ